MFSIFVDMVEYIMEVYMDDVSMVEDSFDSFLTNLRKVLERCVETNLILNWVKCQFMFNEGILLGHKIWEKVSKLIKQRLRLLLNCLHLSL